MPRRPPAPPREAPAAPAARAGPVPGGGWVSAGPGGAVLQVLVQPRASRSRVVGEHDGRLKIQLAAPPVDGEANEALAAFLAAALGVRRSDVAIERGAAGRRKTVRIVGATPEAVAALLREP